MESSQLGTKQSPEFVELRRSARFKLEVDIKISSRSSGTLDGRTVDAFRYGFQFVENGLARELIAEACWRLSKEKT